MTKIPIIDLEATGENICRLRKSRGLSVKDIQEVLGFTNPQAVYRWQSGQSLPTIDNLVILAAIFGTAVDDILVVKGVDDER